MLEFACCCCGVQGAVSDSLRGKSVRCVHCRTTQCVPANASESDSASIAAKGASALAALDTFVDVRTPGPPSPPQYILLQILGTLIIMTGIVQIVVSICLAISQENGAFLLGAVGGLITLGFGSAIFCLRQIGIDVWHIRRR